MAAALDIVGDRWALLIVREVLLGNTRFSQIARNTGAPRDRLSARLRALVDADVLDREVYQESPRREEYRLTESGRELSRVTQALLDWGDRWRSPLRRCGSSTITTTNYKRRRSVRCVERS